MKKAETVAVPVEKVDLSATVEDDTAATTVFFGAQLSDYAEGAEAEWRPDAADADQVTKKDPRPSATIVYFSKWRAKGVAARFRW